MRRTSGVVVSADGQYVFATGYQDNGLVVFYRDPQDGKLSFVESLRQGIEAVEGLARPKQLAVSPDGQHLYLVSNLTESIAAFIIPDQKPEFVAEELGKTAKLYGQETHFRNWSVFVPDASVPAGSQIEFKSLAYLGENRLGFGLRDLGSALRIVITGPDGLTIENFSPPITVCLNYSYSDFWYAGKNAANLLLANSPSEDDHWELLNLEVEEEGVCAEADHTGLFEVFVPLLPETGKPERVEREIMQEIQQINDELKTLRSQIGTVSNPNAAAMEKVQQVMQRLKELQTEFEQVRSGEEGANHSTGSGADGTPATAPPAGTSDGR